MNPSEREQLNLKVIGVTLKVALRGASDQTSRSATIAARRLYQEAWETASTDTVRDQIEQAIGQLDRQRGEVQG